ncbi:protein MpDIR24 [Marchantia polymorpha subsp. ruderalis]|uniref:Dirigent protein n=1 Tax=Marchantia polymorpha TaxID=3197 RepID=A0A2R6WN70_MARPO|nr:hypothetical protein MARPO_0072s0041 [Marchantia polymorpha]BBN03356.1 hypothetical protein Mp_2g22900 [Marchantia polymorpha subsp. ruderalis]|eukprot:PTQ35295.1 hypothetical protein MARPO_0072s0041 [Marchantia polymorpha]
MGKLILCCSLLALIALTEIIPSRASILTLKRPRRLDYYLHDNLTLGNSTTVLVASTSATGGSAGFGDLRVFNSPLRATPDRNSTLIGAATGTLADTSFLEPNVFYISFTHLINMTSCVGTISAQGRVTPAAPTWQVSITGGTGSLVGARGYADVVAFSLTDPTDTVFRYTVYLSF